ncbi:MAG: type II secretion system F family protein [Candidatus Omnitrophica bacterium]|nr:type II secretion system F family protein [Candidatus Omnitrophota bacterium]
MVFKYTVKTFSGETLTNYIESDNLEQARKTLQEKNFVIISISEVKEKRKLKAISLPIKGKVKLDDLVVFSRQLATMVDAGLPIIQALDALYSQTENKVLKDVIEKIKNDVNAGQPLSEALSRHPAIFSRLFVDMVKAGEASGALDDILDRLSSYLESLTKLQKKIKSALFYPLAVLGMAFIITTFLLIKVVPSFQSIFEGLGGKLPAPTQFLINLSNMFKRYFLVVIVAIGFLLSAIRFYLRTERGKTQFDTLLLKLPVFGKLIKKIVVSRFTRTLSTLIKSGISILQALEIVGKTSGNKVIEKTIDNVKQNIKEGQSIAEPLAQTKIFPPMVTKMISIGEQTGSLEEMLTKISDFYDAEVEAAVSGLTSLIEPIIMIFLGVIIGGIAICLLLPIFKVTEMLH